MIRGKTVRLGLKCDNQGWKDVIFYLIRFKTLRADKRQPDDFKLWVYCSISYVR